MTRKRRKPRCIVIAGPNGVGKSLSVVGGSLDDIRQLGYIAEIRGRRPMTTKRKTPKKPESFSAGVGRGLRRSAKTARKVASMHGTPVYFWKNGKVVAEKP
jgi:hypothetical protein